MKKVKITVIKITTYPDLIKEYELPLELPCSLKVGMKFISLDANKPIGFCDTAWETLYPFVKDLANGKGHFYGDWMKNPYSAMVSCNDGFRPVTFYLEVLE